MTHKESQRLEEIDALKPLLNELHVSSVDYSEEPDARIPYNGKTVGIEVVGYHKSEDVMKAYSAFQKSLKKYEEMINEGGVRGMQITVMVSNEQIIFYNRSDEKELFKELDSSINHSNEFFNYILFADADPILPPNAKCEVHSGGIGFVNLLSVDVLKKIVAKKDLRFQQYTKLKQNQDLSEYWLVIYVNQHEYDYFQGQQIPKIESKYDRIYLTHSNDGVLLIKS